MIPSEETGRKNPSRPSVQEISPPVDASSVLSSDCDTSLRQFLERLGPAWLQSPPMDTPVSAPRIGRFEVIEAIGSGGCGQVLKVYDPKLDRFRAMKLPRIEALESSSMRSRFFREAKAAASLDHPNVVKIFEADESGPVCFLIMEYCEKGSLAAWIAGRPDNRPISPRWTAETVARLADGVQHAHSRGVLHRDLKPGNVLLVDRDGPDSLPESPNLTPKVADFGLAKILDDPLDTIQTASDALVGTLAYMAPEQARRDPAGITAATDIYGLGTILYELLTGRRPFGELRHADLIDHILNVEPTPPRTLRPKLPTELDTICRKCLAKSPKDRYETAAALADDLRRWLADEPITARPAPAWKKARSWSRRHPVRVGLISLGLLAILGGLFFAESKARQDAAGWLARLESGNLSGLASLIAERSTADFRVEGPVRELFASGTPDKQLSAAVFLAPSNPKYASYAFERLFAIESGSIKPLTRAMQATMPDLPDRLRAVLSIAPTNAARADREANDRRKARAAACLVHLGYPEQSWQLLRFQPDPQARSFLIHELGPSGVAPRILFDRLRTEPDASARRALIQSLGEVPEGAWDDPLRRQVREKLLSTYREDPDAGVHGSAKWLLKKWKHEDLMDAIDTDLAAHPQPAPGFRWRISPQKITFLRLDDPEGGREIEVSDTEVTVTLFARSRGKYRFDRSTSPEDSCPANTISYHDAAEFCNWLGQNEKQPPSYRPGTSIKWEAVEDYRDHPGYRLPTLEEGKLLCRAGTTTSRFYGDTDRLIGSYIWALPEIRDRLFPVGLLKPNDLGAFDTLGNAFELCQVSRPDLGNENQAGLYGGSVFHPIPHIRWDRAIEGIAQDQHVGASTFGFRIVRTVRLTPPT